MKSTFHEVELGQAVLQNVTSTGTEQLIVTLPPEDSSSVHIQIKELVDGSSPVVSQIAVSLQGLQKLVHWLREEGMLS